MGFIRQRFKMALALNANISFPFESKRNLGEVSMTIADPSFTINIPIAYFSAKYAVTTRRRTQIDFGLTQSTWLVVLTML